MAQTIIGLGDAKAVKRWSASLAVDIAKRSYWENRFVGVGIESDMPVQILTDLETDAGDEISFDLSMQLQAAPIEGDAIQEGTEENLNFYTDGVFLDQMRGGVNGGGRMTRKRTLHNLRLVAQMRESDWFSRVCDELYFMYASGARGVNSDFVYGTDFTGRAGNSLQAPDSNHLLYGGDATSKATIDANDVMSLPLVDKLKAKAQMMGGGSDSDTGGVALQPIRIDGAEHFVLLMNPWQEYDLKTATGEGKWLDLQKAAAGSVGMNSPIFRGALGMYNGVVMHSHKNVIRFNDYGAGGDVEAARALFLGVQALVVGYGSTGSGLRYNWHEEMRDNGNQLVISASTIVGTKKVRFNSMDFGVIAADTAAAEPV